MIRPAIALAALSIVASACTGTATPTASTSAPGSTSPSAGSSNPASTTPSSTPSSPGGATPDPSSTRRGKSTTEKFLLEVSLNTECATSATTMIATVRTKPDVQVGFMARYDSEEFFPDWHWRPRATNTDGNLTWSWQITANHPRGPAALDVVAGNEDGGGTRTVPFRIADAC